MEETSGASVALALRAAHASHHRARSESQIDVVWTGPDGEVDVRLTYAVLIEVMRTATRRLALVSFAAYPVQEVVEALRQPWGRDTAHPRRRYRSAPGVRALRGDRALHVAADAAFGP